MTPATVALAQESKALGDDATLAPETILLKMARVYRTLRSYRDSGEVRTTLLTDGGRAGNDRPFRTAFVRPDRLRFQFTATGSGGRVRGHPTCSRWGHRRLPCRTRASRCGSIAPRFFCARSRTGRPSTP